MNTGDIRTVVEIGQRQSSEYVGERPKAATASRLSHIVVNNVLALFSTLQANQKSRNKENDASLKTECIFFYRFCIA